ncbi:alpha-ketoacid dehydrogenase kinase [Zalerion maritima]|uniref:Protein-serine/threonine kinase n=1 Tax=Zalerion maritima TaxID=339359 RepID=A0AAD5RKJ2_9PEZI|nr:alpha-ketoacid dehydrogenase kinase [Zalerion maritima]
MLYLPLSATFSQITSNNSSSYRGIHDTHIPQAPKWRPVTVLDEWVGKEARPISLRQLMVFGRSLTEARLISSANYVRTELPTRIAHRIRDMQRLPYVVVTNPHIQEVYELYYAAFETFRRVREIKTLDDNDKFCSTIASMLRAHLTVIPKLAMGVLQCSELMDNTELDRFMNTILRSRISRRVIAEQHLSLTETFNAPWFSPGAKLSETEFIGEVFLKCVAKDVIDKCGRTINQLARAAYGPHVPLPEIKINGHLEANFPYILSHIEYVVGELLRNSVTAVVEQNLRHHIPMYSIHAQDQAAREELMYKMRDKCIPKPHQIEVTICESAQHVTIRVSDRGGGIDRDELPYLWSFAKSHKSSDRRLENISQVPKMAATLAELGPADGIWPNIDPQAADHHRGRERESASFRKKSDEWDEHDKLDGKEADDHHHTKGKGKEKHFDGGDKEDDPLNHTHPHASSLSSLSSRPPNLRLGMGLPLSRVYAEYWAGKLELHSLEGYGVDMFLQISKLGNKNEQLTTRATMDAV